MAEFNWYPLSSGASSLVDCIIKHETDLYVGGMFSTVGGIATTGIAKWNGTEWNSVDGGVGYVQQILSGNVYPRVRTIAIYNDEIFIGGLFNRAGGQVVSNVAKLEKDSDGNYKFVPIEGFDEQVFKLKVIDGELYAGGSFFNITNSSGINVRSLSNEHRGFVRWNPDNNQWEETEIPTNGTVTDIVKFQDELYLTYGGTVCAVYNNKLYVGGNFDFWEGNAITNLAVTSDKITWSSVGGGFSDYNVRSSGSQFDTTVESLFVYENNLYVGGIFNRVGSTNHVLGLPVTSIAKWNGSDWSSLGTRNTVPAIRTIFGVDEETTENQLGSLNKGLYVGGSFPAVPGTLANNIALYTDSFTSTSVIGNEGVPCKPIFPCGYTRKQPVKSVNAVLIPGPQGPPGPEGPQGPPGLDAKYFAIIQSSALITITPSGPLRWKYQIKKAKPIFNPEELDPWIENPDEGEIFAYNLLEIPNKLNTGSSIEGTVYGGIEVVLQDNKINLKDFIGYEYKPVPNGVIAVIYNIENQNWFSMPNPIVGNCNEPNLTPPLPLFSPI